MVRINIKTKLTINTAPRCLEISLRNTALMAIYS
jgi:hypothetical protein